MQLQQCQSKPTAMAPHAHPTAIFGKSWQNIRLCGVDWTSDPPLQCNPQAHFKNFKMQTPSTASAELP
jgi:hypothetical protein